jgi:hypothetical protein
MSGFYVWVLKTLSDSLGPQVQAWLADETWGNTSGLKELWGRNKLGRNVMATCGYICNSAEYFWSLALGSGIY